MQWANKDAFKAALKRRGFVWLGSGVFASVYGKPGQRKVIKVGPVSDPWPAYVEWAKRKGHAGKLAPRVSSFRVIKPRHGPPFYVAVVERLASTVEEVRYTNATSGAVKKYNALVRYSDRFAPLSEIGKRYPETLRFVRGVKGLARTGGFRFDMHDLNWMIRKNGQLVLNDPFTARTTPQKYLDKASAAFSKRRGKSLKSAHV